MIVEELGVDRRVWKKEAFVVSMTVGGEHDTGLTRQEWRRGQ